MLNTEYDREYCFDIDAYLIATYSGMNMTTRRTVCRLALAELDDELLEEAVDAVVAQLALDKQKWVTPEEDEEEEDEDEE